MDLTRSCTRRNRALRPLHRFLAGLPGRRAQPRPRGGRRARTHRLPRPQARSHSARGCRCRSQPGARPCPQRRRAAMRNPPGCPILPIPLTRSIACRGLKPDLTLLVDVDAEASLARARARNAAAPHCETRLDDESIEFHRAVWHAYHALAAAEPQRVKVVDGRTGIDAIERAVWEIVSGHV